MHTGNSIVDKMEIYQHLWAEGFKRTESIWRNTFIFHKKIQQRFCSGKRLLIEIEKKKEVNFFFQQQKHDSQRC